MAAEIDYFTRVKKPSRISMVKLCRHRGSRSRQCPGPRLLQHFFAARRFGHYIYVYTYIHVSFLVAHTFWRQPCSKEQRRIAQYQQHLPRSRCIPDVKSAKTTRSLRLPDSTVIFSDAIDILPSYLTATSFNRRTASSTPSSAGWALTCHMASTSFESLEYNLQAEHWGLSWFVMVCHGLSWFVMVCHGLSISASLQSPSDPSDVPTWGRKVTATVGMAGATEIHALRWSKQTRHVPAVPAFRFETEIL